MAQRGLQQNNQLLSYSFLGQRGEAPLGCWFWVSGEMDSQVPAQKVHLTLVLVATLVWLSVSRFSSSFQKFWNPVVCFGHGTAKHIKQLLGWQRQPFFPRRMYRPVSPAARAAPRASLRSSGQGSGCASLILDLFLHSKHMSAVWERSHASCSVISLPQGFGLGFLHAG